MKKITSTLLVLLGITFGASAQDAFKPSGKPVIRIFSNAHTDFSDGESQTTFELTRAYLGYEHKFSKEISGAVVYDVGDPGAGKHQMAGFVKNAYLNYEKDNLSIDFGLISTTQFKVQEKFWGYRYLLKSFQDEYSFASSADLGASITYEFNDVFSADFAIYNGEGYKKLQSDEFVKPTLGLTLTPAKGLIIRGMADVMGDENAQQTYAGFVGYNSGKLSLAAEYNYQKNNGMVDGKDYFGTSFYSTYTLSKKAKFFARYDDLQSKTISGNASNWNLAKDGSNLVLGYEFTPVSGVKLSPNYRGWNPADDSRAFVSTLMINCEIKF